MNVNEVATGLGFELVSATPASAGQGRTYFGETKDFGQVVVKWSNNSNWVRHIPVSVLYTEALRDRGYPAAEVLAHGPVVDGYGIVQQRLPGVPIGPAMTVDVLMEVIEAMERQVDAPPHLYASVEGHDWIPSAVFEDSVGWLGAARSINAEVNELCDRLERWVRQVPPPEVRTDFVHLDINFSNILVEHGALSGIIDLDHLAIGDRCVDLALLAFEVVGNRYDSGTSAIPESVVDELREHALRISGESGWRLAVGYNSASWLGWSSPTGLRVPVDKAVAVVRTLIGSD